MTTIIITCISVYVLSAFFMWLHIHISHNKGGRWSSLPIDKEEIFYTFIPIVNSIGTIISWILFFPKEFNISQDKLTTFFNIKK